MIRHMVSRRLIQRIAACLVALGLLFSGAVPGWARPMAGNRNAAANMAVTMPSMAMDDCMAMMGKDSSPKKMPSKSGDLSCTICAFCAVNVGLTSLIPAPFSRQRDAGLIVSDVNPDGIAVPPALPPPILRA